MAYRYSSSIDYQQAQEDSVAPDIIYYNGDIINNQTDTPLQANKTTYDPQIRFSETRDTALIKDASLYNFSIVRFTMNGAGKDLPLFMPQVQTNTLVNPLLNVNMTVYNHNISMRLTTLATASTSPSTVPPYAPKMTSFLTGGGAFAGCIAPVNGTQYTITILGTTNWSAIGWTAPVAIGSVGIYNGGAITGATIGFALPITTANSAITTITLNSSDYMPYPSSVGLITPGLTYVITKLGSSNMNWSALGLVGATPSQGSFVNATGAVASGVGYNLLLASNLPGAISASQMVNGVQYYICSPGTTPWASYGWANNLGGTLGTYNSTYTAPTIPIQSMVVGNTYEIVSLGDTPALNWSILGWTGFYPGFPPVGARATYTSPTPIGTGTVRQVFAVPPNIGNGIAISVDAYNAAVVGIQNFNNYAVPCIYQSETLDTDIAPIPSSQSISSGKQDVSTRYYWVYSYGSWLRLVNASFAQSMTYIQNMVNELWTLPTSATIYGQQGLGFSAVPSSPFYSPPMTIGTSAPFIGYNPSNNLFSLYGDSYGFGWTDGSVFAAPNRPAYQATQTSISTSNNNTPSVLVGVEQCRLYFNQNLNGLFNNFKNTYGEATWGNNANYQNFNEIFIGNYLNQNVATVALPVQPSAIPPNQRTPTPAIQKSYWLMIQDSESTSTLWCPVSSIVFTSGFLPIVNESTGQPIVFGTGNVNTQSTVQSAFQPIITDVALANQTASDYRGFINYTPTAEYRITSFQRGRNEVRQIDIQVWWKNRLDGQLYPLQMYNLSSVGIKIMFRKKGATIHGLGKMP
jgi:hypothetical protein